MRLISPREYAALTGQKFQSVYYKIKSGKLPHRRVERTVIRIPWDDAKGEACQG